VRAADPGAESQWLGFNGGPDATRYSPLKQVDTKNAASLTEVGRFRMPETLRFQSEPVVIRDTIESGPAWVAIFALPGR
jgi:glucose dehydrogenase